MALQPLQPCLEPDWKFVVRPHKAIDGRQIPAFVVADLLSATMDGSPSDAHGYYVSSSDDGISQNWQRLNSDLSISDMGFSRFNRNGSYIHLLDGSNDALSRGLSLLRRRKPLRTQIGTDPFPVRGDGPVSWRIAQGNTTSLTYGDTDGSGRGILLYGTGKGIVETQPMAKGQAISLDLSFLANSNSTNKWCFVRLAPDLRVSFVDGMPITLDQAQDKYDEGDGWRMTRQEWGARKTLHELGNVDFGGTNYKMSFEHLGGRLVWKINGHAFHFIDPDPSNPGAGLPIEFGGHPLRIEKENCAVEVQLDVLSSAGVTGVVKRRIHKRSIEAQTITTPRPGGHFPSGTKVDISTEVVGDYIEYTATIEGDEDGIFSPLLSQIHLVQKPVWVSGSADGYDISRAVTRSDVVLGHPPLMAGSEGSMVVDIPLVQKFLPEALGALKDYCPVEISARWRENGTPLTNHKGLFRGYIYGTRGEEPSYNTGTLSFTLRDPIVRLRSPAGIVDSRAAPLDFDFLEKLEALGPAWAQKTPYIRITDSEYVPAPDDRRKFWGVECVKAVLEQAMGPAHAALLNGGDLFRYFDESYPALLSYADFAPGYSTIAEVFGQSLSSASLKSQTGWIFEPPYKSDYLGWINKFCADERAVFLYGYADRDTDDWPIPLYGRHDFMLRRARLLPVVGGELISLSSETRPDVDFNRTWVIGNQFDAKIPLGGGLNQGEARLPYGHPSSGFATWDRTYMLETNLAVSGSDSMSVAALILSQMDNNGLLPQWPTWIFRGDPFVQIGDVLPIEVATQLNLNGLWFSAARLTHSYTVDPREGRDWRTTANLQRMSRSQEIAFRRANNLPIPI